MPIVYTKAGHVVGASSETEVLVAICQALARHSANAEAALTDSSGGTAGTVVDGGHGSDVTNQAAVGSDLADTTSTAAALNAVLDAERELATKANAIASKLGIAQITWNGGGASPDGTIGAISNNVTGATTGCQATQINSTLQDLDRGLFVLARFINRLCVAAGVSEVDLGVNAAANNFSTTVSAITVATGSAADPGVKKSVIDARLTTYRNSIATLAAKLNAIRAGVGNAPVLVVG